MEPRTDNPPLVVIVGQTASGKSALALELASQFNGEIICADSRTVYKGMDIGTAKASERDRRLIRHHLLDITQPDQSISAATFKQKAEEAIYEIATRGKLPFIVGGTGLYVDAVLFDYSFAPVAASQIRKELANTSTEQLQAKLRAENIPLPRNDKNPRHLIRQLETGGIIATKAPLRNNTLIMGMSFLEYSELRSRLAQRLEQMLAQGLEREVKHLVTKFGWGCSALETIGYKEFKPYFSGKEDLVSVKAAIVHHSLQYAKRQKTWFKRNPHIQWICKKEQAVELITSFLNKNYIG